MINYESEIEEVVMKHLSMKYGIEDEDVLYRYLKLRFKCMVSLKKAEDEQAIFGKFLLNELGVYDYVYKQETISFYSSFDNSITSIVQGLDFRANLLAVVDENHNKQAFKDYIERVFNEINKEAEASSKHYLKDKYYKYHLYHYRLTLLNERFKIKEIKEVPCIDGFKQDLFKISFEEECLRYIHASNFNTENIKTIKEEDLEDFLYCNLNLIEEGLRPIKRQYEIEEGKIDILAVDKNNNYVIVELKISNDKHLIWQSLYYPLSIKKQLRIENVRMITVCPSYPNYIKEPLKLIPGVEMVQYKALLSNKKIDKIELFKIN